MCCWDLTFLSFYSVQNFGGNEFTFVGQAYVDGIMDYKRDLRQDIESGKIKSREFILR